MNKFKYIYIYIYIYLYILYKKRLFTKLTTFPCYGDNHNQNNVSNGSKD